MRSALVVEGQLTFRHTPAKRADRNAHQTDCGKVEINPSPSAFRLERSRGGVTARKRSVDGAAQCLCNSNEFIVSGTGGIAADRLPRLSASLNSPVAQVNRAAKEKRDRVHAEPHDRAHQAKYGLQILTEASISRSGEPG